MGLSNLNSFKLISFLQFEQMRCNTTFCHTVNVGTGIGRWIKYE